MPTETPCIGRRQAGRDRRTVPELAIIHAPAECGTSTVECAGSKEALAHGHEPETRAVGHGNTGPLGVWYAMRGE